MTLSDTLITGRFSSSKQSAKLSGSTTHPKHQCVPRCVISPAPSPLLLPLLLRSLSQSSQRQTTLATVSSNVQRKARREVAQAGFSQPAAAAAAGKAWWCRWLTPGAAKCFNTGRSERRRRTGHGALHRHGAGCLRFVNITPVTEAVSSILSSTQAHPSNAGSCLPTWTGLSPLSNGTLR